MLALRLTALFLTLFPAVTLIVVLLRRKSVSRSSVAISLLLSALVFALLTAFHQEQHYELLDPTYYRMMSDRYASGDALCPIQPSLSHVPADLRPPFFMLPNRPSLDGCFRYLDPSQALSATASTPEAFRTIPCFLPLLPLAASALGPFYDAFPPLMGALLLLAMLSVALAWKPTSSPSFSAPAPRYRILCAVFLFFATFFPAWFFRGFYADAIGGTLLATALLTLLAPAFRGQFTLAGFALAFSIGFHFTMALYALPVAFYAIVREGSWRKTRSFALSALAGCALVALEIAVAGSPYSSGGLSGFLDAARHVPVIGALLILSLGLVVAAAAVLVMAHQPRIRAWFESLPTHFHGISFALVATTGVLLVSFVPVPQLTLGRACLHPLMVGAFLLLVLTALWPLYRCHNGFRSERLYGLLVAVTSLFALYLKGAEKLILVSGVWGYRRLFPVVALLLPMCLYGLLARRLSRRTTTLLALSFLVPFCASPLLWFGVHEKGADAAARHTLKAVGTPDFLLYDNRERMAIWTINPALAAFSLDPNALCTHWDSCSTWLLNEAKKGSNVVLSTSFQPCTLEDGVALEPTPEQPLAIDIPIIHTKQLWPTAKESKILRDTLLTMTPLRDLASCPGQHKVFDGGPLGLRGPWIRANRGGAWSAETGCGIVGPVPRPGTPVTIHLEAEWFDSTGTNPVTRIRLIPPYQSAEPLEFDLPSSRQTIRHIALSTVPPETDLPLTGIWTFEGAAVVYRMDLTYSSSTFPNN